MEKLLKTGQVFSLWSLTKSWLSPQSFGINFVPLKFNEAFKKETTNLSNNELNEIGSYLEQYPNLAKTQEGLFKDEWAKLVEKLHSIDPSWNIPEIGYFSTIGKSFTDLIDLGIMTIPASVFGHNNVDISIISCLFLIEPKI